MLNGNSTRTVPCSGEGKVHRRTALATHAAVAGSLSVVLATLLTLTDPFAAITNWMLTSPCKLGCRATPCS